jgi:hypothetical protein
MSKRFLLLLVTALLLSSGLVACGDETAPVPTYSGATSLTVPDVVAKQFNLKTAKSTTVAVYKTTDKADKVKAALIDGFNKGGWTDKSADMRKDIGEETIKNFELDKGFMLGYQKGNKQAVIMAFSGLLAEDLTITGAAETDTVYLVLSGNV